MYRIDRTTNEFTLYTTSATLANDAVSSGSFNEGPSPGLIASTASACDTCGVDLVPVYEISSTTDTFYTATEEEGAVYVSMGYSGNGILFYCASEPNACGASLPWNRFQTLGERFTYSTDMTNGQDTYDGLVCYIWPEM